MIPLVCPHIQSTAGPGLTHKTTGHCIRVGGRGSGVFLTCVKKVIFLIQCRGAVSPPQVKFFLKRMLDERILLFKKITTNFHYICK